MYVHPPKHWWKNWAFFRPKIPKSFSPLPLAASNDDEPLGNDADESLPEQYYEYESIPESHDSPISTPEAGKKGLKLKSKFKSKKTRRGWGKGNKSLNFSLFGNNANGIKAKKDSLINTLKNFNVPSCVLLQETKLRFQGTFKLPGYQPVAHQICCTNKESMGRV